MYLYGPQKRTIYTILVICKHTISTNRRFPFRGGQGGLPDNDHEFPFAGDIELLRRSLSCHGLDVAPRFKQVPICGWLNVDSLMCYIVRMTREYRLVPVLIVMQFRSKLFTRTLHCYSWPRCGSLRCFEYIHVI